MSQLSPSTADLSHRLRMLGELARRINEYPSIQDLARFLHSRLGEHLPVDAFSVALAVSSEERLRAVFVVDGRTESPPEGLLPSNSHDGRNDRAEAPARSPVRQPAAQSGLPYSHLICAVQAGNTQLGQIEIAAYRANAYSADDAQFLQTIADQSAAVFERHLADADAGPREKPRGAEASDAFLAALTNIAAVLGTISANIAEEHNPGRIYSLILHQAATVIPYDQASITLFEEGAIVTGAAVGATLHQLPIKSRVERRWRDYQNLDYAAYLEYPGLARALAEAGLHDLLSLPLLLNGAVVGRLTFASRRPNQYDAYHVQLGALLAERTAQVVRMVQLQTAQEAAQAKVAQLETLRHDFVATVSHELRTPLTGILGYLELLLSRWASLDESRRRGMLQRAQSSAVRLEHLVTDLLLFSNVEHQELQLQAANYPLMALVDQAVEDMSTKYRGQTIEVHPSKTRAMVRADAHRAIQVLANLLDNAIKYSAEGKPVHVRWTVRRREVEVTVRDWGPGIRSEDVSRLFTRFGTLGHQPRPGQVGTGIGLYICKKLLDAMGGRIWVTSTPGRGSVFHFTLPSAADSPATRR